MPEITVTEDLIQYMREFMPSRMKAFFNRIKKDHGKVSVVISTHEAVCYYSDENPGDDPPKRDWPHPVHFREGMIIRNGLRASELCNGWTDNDFDNLWAEIVEKAIEETE